MVQKVIHGKFYIILDTWRAVGERKTLKAEINSTTSERIKNPKRQQYKEKDKDVKRMSRSVKWKMIDSMAEIAEKAAQMNHTGTFYTESLCSCVTTRNDSFVAYE